jgi:hypothetical protein
VFFSNLATSTFGYFPAMHGSKKRQKIIFYSYYLQHAVFVQGEPAVHICGPALQPGINHNNHHESALLQGCKSHRMKNPVSAGMQPF